MPDGRAPQTRVQELTCAGRQVGRPDRERHLPRLAQALRLASFACPLARTWVIELYAQGFEGIYTVIVCRATVVLPIFLPKVGSLTRATSTSRVLQFEVIRMFGFLV